MADLCHCRSMDGCWQAGVSRRAGPGMDKLRKAGVNSRVVDINVDTDESVQAGIGGGEMGMGTGVGTRWAIPAFVDIPYSCLQR
jgi:hypothetical protein